MITKKHTKEFAFAFISALAKSGTPIVILVVLANKLSILGFSQIAFGLLVFSLTLVVLDLGYQVRMPEMIAKGAVVIREWFSVTLGVKILASLFLILFVSSLLLMVLDIREAVIGIVFLIAGAFFSVSLHCMYVLRGLFKFETEASTLLVTEIITLVVVISLINAQQTPSMIAVGFLLAKIVQALISFWAILGIVKPVRLALSGQEGRAVIPYTVQTIVGGGFLLVDGLIVKGAVNDLDFSIHQMFVRLVIIACFIMGPVQILLVSYLARLRKSARFGRHVWASVSLLSASAALILSVYWYFDAAIIHLALGDRFLVITEYSWFLVSIVFLRYASVTFGIVLSVSDAQVLRAKILAAVFIGLIILNMILVPTYGIVGAFYSSLVAHLVLGLAYVVMGMNSLRPQCNIRSGLKNTQ